MAGAKCRSCRDFRAYRTSLAVPIEGMVMKEAWRDIPGYEGYYQASTLGRIRSVDRVVLRNGKFPVRWRGRIVVQFHHNSSTPYFKVSLNKQNCQKSWLVHQLVMLTWVGSVPLGFEVRHSGNGYADNSLYNLSYGSRSDNEKDKERDGTGRHTKVRRSDGVEFASINEAAKQTDCWASKITAVCRGWRKTAGGYGWVYI